MSTRDAAEGLTDIAYALVAGETLQLTLGHERLSVPLGDELRMQREMTSNGDRIHLQLRLTWCTAPPSREDASDDPAV
jgi:hypothetical protein